MSEKRKSVLHEILAVEPDVKAQTNVVLAETQRVFKNAKDYLEGEVITVETLLDDEPEHEGSEKLMVTTVPERLEYTLSVIAKEAAVSAAKAATNAVATANVILPGGVTLSNVPAEVIMKFIDKLKQVRGVLNMQPTLDSRVKWALDDQKVDVYTAPTKSKIGARHVTEFQVVVPATDHHPADVRDVSKQIPARKTMTTKTSGAIPSVAKAKQMKVCDRCIEACKKALERANCTEIMPVKEFDQILELIRNAD